MASLRQVFSCSFLSLCLPFVAASVGAQTHKAPALPHKYVDRTLPLVFERNEGQLPAGVGFLGITQHYSVAVGSKDLTFLMPGPKETSSVVLSFNGSDAAPPIGVTAASFLTNYYVGNDPSKFHTGIKNYSRVGLSHVYPGVDAQFYATGETIEHDFLVAPKADASLISMQISGAEKATVTAKGEVLIPATAGELRLKKPVAYQLGPQGKHVEVAANFVLSANGDSRELHFQLGDYDHSRELVIDPEIVYATYYSGSDGSTAGAITSDSAGNVFLVGSTTSPATSFGTTAIRNFGNSGTPGTIAFVAKFLATDAGTNVSWFTIIGSQTTAPSAATSVALQQGPTPTDVFFAGTTSATDFPTTGGSFQSVVPTASVQRGFVGSLKSSDGSRDGITFIDSDPTNQVSTTAVNAVASDSNGNVIAVGAAAGAFLPVTADAIAVDAPTLASSALKGFAVLLDPTMVTELFGTYLMGNAPGDTSFTGVASDTSSNIYVAGYTAGVFPIAGTTATGSMNPHNAADTTGYDSFVAQIAPVVAPATTATIGYSVWFSGSATDQLNAIAVDPTGNNNLLVFGQTASADLLSNITYTSAITAVAAPIAGLAGAPISATLPAQAPATTSGFIARIDPNGQPLVATYLGGAGNDSVTAGTVDSTGLVYAAGTSNSIQSMGYAGAALLPAGQDRTTANVQHGFVSQLQTGLSFVNYIANIGGATGPDSVAGVALDGTNNAYVAANIAKLSLPYTNFTAFQFAPRTALLSTSSAAYIAEIATTPASSSLALVAAATGNPDPIGYVAASPETITYTWTLNANTATPPDNLNIEIPANQYLSYTGIQIVDTTTNTALATAICSTPSAGATCRIPLYPQATAGTNDTLSVVLTTSLLSQPPSSTITVTATVYGPGSDSVSAAEISNVNVPTQLSISASAAAVPAGYLFTTNSGATTPNTVTSYSFTISNPAGAGNAPNTIFSLTPPSGATAFVTSNVTTATTGGATATTTCTSTGCNLSIPSGGSFTVTLTGTYPDAALTDAGGASGTASGTFSASVSAFLSSASTTLTPTPPLRRGVHLKVTAVLSALPTGQTAFNLADPITYTVAVANSGPSSSSGTDTLSVTLPNAFVATSTPGLTCTGTPSICTLSIPATASGSSAGPYIIGGGFADNLANASIGATPVSQSFSATVALNGDYESAVAGTDYSTSVNTTVQRTAKILITTATITPPAAPCASGAASCAFMVNTADLGDKINYSFVIQNQGPNTDVGATITIPLPSAPANPAGTAHPLIATPATFTVAAPTFGSTLTCTVSSAPNQIVCTGGNLPVGTSVINLSGYLTADANTVPATSIFVTAPSSGTVSATGSGAGATATGTALPSIEIDRVSHLVTTKAVALTGTTPASPINLDENNPSLAAGVNDTFTVSIALGNTPLNSVPGVVLTDTLPPYFRVTQIPAAAAHCTVGGAALAANYTTGATAVTMTCAIGTVATGTATPSAGGTAATVGTPAIAFTYSGKFVDNGVNADITGASLAAKVKALTVPLSAAASTAAFTFDPITPSDATSATSSIAVIRAAHLVTVKTVAPTGTSPASPVNLDENKPSLTPGVDDTVTATVSIGNTPLNSAIGVTLTDTLPPYFRVTQVSASASTCTVGGTALATNYTTGATAVTLTCTLGTIARGTATPSAGATAATVGAPNYTFTYSGKFLDNGVNADITGTTLAAKVKSLTVSLNSAASVTPYAVDPLAQSDATSLPASVAVQRQVHFILRKTRNTTVAVAPSTFTDTTDPNLDEKTTAARFGANDEVEYDIALANGGRNMALGVQFTDTLPPYFTLVSVYAISGSSITPVVGANSVPSNQLTGGSVACYTGPLASGTPLPMPYSTGAASMQITCTYGTATTPLSLAAGPSTAGNLDNATSIEFIYQGKFEDNAPAVDNIGAGVSTAAIVSKPGDAIGSAMYAVDPGPVGDASSLALATYNIQRAAHLKFLAVPTQTLTNETALTTGASGPIIAQAEPSTVTGATPVFNCLRYKVYIQNVGPNIARQPKLSLTAPAGLNITSIPTGMTSTPGTDPPLASSCAYGTPAPATTITGAPATPLTETPGAALIVDVDGYFGLNTLTAGNSLTLPSTVSYTALSDAGIQDSLKSAPFTTVSAPSVTVVNTPFGSNFAVTPFSTTGTRQTTLSFTSVATPGITSESITADGPALPSGPSPDPRDNKKTINLYRSGSGTVNYYRLNTTAVPSAGANPTGVCVANSTPGLALSDFFAKPERVLLWSLQNTPAGTSFRSVPNVVAPVSGDITTTVVPVSGTSYVEAGGSALPYTSFASFPGPQTQPAMVCGTVNGFAPNSAPLTLAVLEPVNFAPFTVPNSATISTTPGKGVSEVSFLFPTTHDYNDNDPCYIASGTAGTGTRQVCDDNLVLTTWIFGGESLIPSQSHVIGPLTTTQANTFINSPTAYEVQGGQTLFDLVADQVAVTLYRAANFCDPGNAPGSYSPITTPAPCPINIALLSGAPPQEVVYGSADIAQLQPAISGGSTGLIILPPAATPTSSSTPVLSGYIAAAATVTAGQTVGFQWKLGDIVPTATGGIYNLACYGVDASTQTVVTPFPAGLTCQLPATITFPPQFTVATAPTNPAIYVVTTGTLARNAAPVTGAPWKAIGGGIVVALLIPLMVARRRYPRQFGLLTLLLLLTGGVGLSGCGTGGSIGSTGTAAVTPGTYYFRASATSTSGAPTLTSTAFSVKVVAGN